MSLKSAEIHHDDQYTLTEAGHHINTDWFAPDILRQKGHLQGKAQGRGNAWFIRIDNTDCVLRHYYRGGVIANLLHDRYFWIGLARTRAWQEWHLLAKLCELNLPAPHPVAAKVHRAGLFYRADLITRRIPNTQTLAQCLKSEPMPHSLWQKIGNTIARFHVEKIWHADLNARNILIDNQNKVFLIDFDKARFRPHTQRWQQKNLQRLQRSLHKINDSGEALHFDGSSWKQLIRGYKAA
jgi:3-deoxy-D-manno-octulosonic acid kinase